MEQQWAQLVQESQWAQYLAYAGLSAAPTLNSPYDIQVGNDQASRVHFFRSMRNTYPHTQHTQPFPLLQNDLSFDFGPDNEDNGKIIKSPYSPETTTARQAGFSDDFGTATEFSGITTDYGATGSDYYLDLNGDDLINADPL